VDGYSSFEEWELKQYIPATLQATTPSGGRHIFLKKPKGVQISQDIKVRPGIDIKAHPNNYVLVAPSNNPKG
ncbi:bifunctional DNA primase/polymerase, partial [Streptococcus suis]